jgi:hypothetical protein
MRELAAEEEYEDKLCALCGMRLGDGLDLGLEEDEADKWLL